MAVLVYLARRAGEVISADELNQSVWRERVVGDDAIYQRIHRLRAALEDDPHQPRYIETIPKKGYRLVAPVEFLDDGDSNSVAATRRRPALVSAMVIAGLLAVGTYVFWDRAPSDLTEDPASRQPDVNSIAVLPFVDMSDDQSQKYLGDGIAEELIHALSNVPGLRVAARTSAFRFADKDVDIPTIGKQLNVATVLEGSIRKQGGQVRVTAQLVSVADGYHLWSMTFDRDVQDLIAVQQEIALAVAEIFQTSAGDNFVALLDAPTPSIDAYDYYLLGREHLRHREPTGMEQSIAYFQQAIEIDPDFARAYAGLAMAYQLLHFYGRRFDKELPLKARAAAEHALAIDDRDSEAYAALGLIRNAQSDFQGANEALRRAIEINPNNALAYMWLANASASNEETLQAMETAAMLDPLSAHIQMNLGDYYYGNGQIETAQKYHRRAIELEPTFWLTYNSMARNLTSTGQLDQVVLMISEYFDQVGGNIHTTTTAPRYLMECYRAMNDLETAEYWLDRFAASDPPSEILNKERALALLARHNFEAAGKLLHGWVTEALVQPRYLNHIAWFEMIIGHDAHALRLYKQVAEMPQDRGLGDNNLFNKNRVEFGQLPAVSAANLYLRVKQFARARELLEQSRVLVTEVMDHPMYRTGGYYVLASIDAIEGDRDQALHGLRQAIESGWRHGWYTEQDPNFDSLHDDLEFIEILADLETRNETMLERLRQAEAENIAAQNSSTE